MLLKLTLLVKVVQLLLGNNFEVDGETTFNSSVKLCGGTSSFSFVGVGGSLGTTPIAHASGVLGLSTFNQNVDIVSYFRSCELLIQITIELTLLVLHLGDATSQDIKTGAGLKEPDLPRPTGKQYYLPLLNNSTHTLMKVIIFYLMPLLIQGLVPDQKLFVLQLVVYQVQKRAHTI